MKQTLDLERNRAKAASERDAETIIELRTALEVERENNVNSGNQQAMCPDGLSSNRSTMLGEGFGCVALTQDENRQGNTLLISNPNFTSLIAEEVKGQHVQIICQLQTELQEERSRVDALKICLEQEREKSEMLMLSSKADPTTDDASLQHEWIVFNQRRFEALEMSRTHLAKQLERQKLINARVLEDLQIMRTHRMEDLQNDEKVLRDIFCNTFFTHIYSYFRIKWSWHS